MKKNIITSYHPSVVFTIILLITASFAQAQLGSGWVQYSPTKRIHLDDEAGLQTFSWSSYRSVCSPVCADYTYTSSNDTETFRLFDNRTNRSEIRLQNEYSTGSRQFEGYVTFYSPLDDESLMQIFGSTSGATQLMIRGYAADGGSMRGAGQTLITGIYGVEVRVNVIHLQENVGNKIMIYINGVKKAEIADNEAVTNYHKYGNYGTLRTDEAVVKWRQARFFRDGTAPSSSTPNLALNRPVTASSEPQPENPASSAVDGNTGTRWSANGYPQWMEVDLGSVQSINKTELVCYQDRAYQYTISVKTSSSGSYTQIVNRSSNTTPGSSASPITDNFSAVNARYVRLNITGASGYTGTWASISEFRVFGPSGSREAQGRTGITDDETDANEFNIRIAPNPVAGKQAAIRYSLPEAGQVRIAIYNLSGQAEEITNAYQQAGNHTLYWNINGKPAGVYVARFMFGNKTKNVKITVQ